MASGNIFSQIKPLFTLSLSEIVVSLILLEFLAFSIATSTLHVDSFTKDSIEDFTSSSQTFEQYEAISAKINSNEYVANGVIFLIWSCVGLGLLNIVLLIRSSEQWLEDVVHLLGKDGSYAKFTLHERTVQLSIRSIALLLITLLTIGLVRYILPLLLTLLDTSELRQPFEYVLPIIATWLILSLIGHAYIVLLRCLALRTRLIIRSGS